MTPDQRKEAYRLLDEIQQKWFTFKAVSGLDITDAIDVTKELYLDVDNKPAELPKLQPISRPLRELALHPEDLKAKAEFEGRV